MIFYKNEIQMVVEDGGKLYPFSIEALNTIFGSIEDAIAFYHMRGDMDGYIPFSSKKLGKDFVEIART